jgi:hypothetical protein
MIRYIATKKMLEEERFAQARVKLQQLYMPESCAHKHAVVAISGFLSENDDQHESWATLK